MLKWQIQRVSVHQYFNINVSLQLKSRYSHGRGHFLLKRAPIIVHIN